ncbi:calmodulin [Vairimorpha necatrix]|uniref:Calmodulin n=1 Tax=Vairimorpha necatrix TaxID=6039 RepID=A0AAX4JAA1_9MICR
MDYKNRLSKVFQLFVDSPHETVHVDDLYKLFSHAGFSLTDKALEKIRQSCPETGLSFSEYLIHCEELQKNEISKEELRQCLESLSSDKSDTVDANTLINTLSTGQYALDEYELAEILRIINPDANGKVSIMYLLSLIYSKDQ